MKRHSLPAVLAGLCATVLPACDGEADVVVFVRTKDFGAG
jgi:hypothetical protein